MARSARWWMALAAALASSSPGAALARTGAPEPDVFDADDPTVGAEPLPTLGGADPKRVDEDIVLAAQKVRRTIQDAPSIITVITREQIQQRGYRTINDVMRTVAGFEGDRWEGNGWHREAFARGLPQTVLVLVNGVSIVEPVRNMVNLDRKIPLEIVERIEVTSGPGGILWGSNALLGVINIVTRRPSEGEPLVHALVGFGDGPADRLQFKAGLGLNHRFSDTVGLFAHLNLYTTEGPELTADMQKVVGALPEPAEDGPTLYLPTPITVASGKRSWFFNFAGRLELGKVALDWMLPFEDDYRPLATGGAVLTENYLDPDRPGTVTRSSDSIRLVNLSYADRFADSAVGINSRLYLVTWDIQENPFGVYSASPVLYASYGHTRDLRLGLVSDLIARTGAAVDVDIAVTDDLTVITGAEAFIDTQRGIQQHFWASDVLGVCPEGFTYAPDDPYLPCRITDTLIGDVTRLISGAFVSADWRLHDRFALNGGVRLQASDAYDPTLLYSGGLVWELLERTHLKVFASAGLRPPSTNSTHTRDTTSGVTFQANPDLQAETSSSLEGELNTTLLRDAGPLRDLFLRFNGAYTLMDNVIGRPGGRFENSGQRDIVSGEAMVRLRFDAGHQLWANYTYTQVFDDAWAGGEIRNFARHMGNVGGTLSLLGGSIELTGIVNVKGSMQDPNRRFVADPSRPDLGATCAQLSTQAIPSEHPLSRLQAICAMPGMGDGVWVFPGTDVTETIRPLTLVDVGVRFKNLWRDMTASVFLHNLLDHRYYEPDFFGDPRVLSRPQPKPGLSVFAQLSIGLDALTGP